ncbi:MAG: hypothetical protein CM1200mP1_17010 [Candidatus Neomarinimicrobiota bacterium]|nr:MAG: hypothetical protein CM1200mP1_17010 [Candidatus Neomarinimicrobiota bacterium]
MRVEEKYLCLVMEPPQKGMPFVDEFDLQTKKSKRFGDACTLL